MTSWRDPYRLLRSPVGRLLLRPWFDQAALGWLRRLHFPLSRAWAAAAASDGSLERFWPGIGGARPGQQWLAERAVVAAVRRRCRYEEAEAGFQRGVFAEGPNTPDRLASLTEQRSRAAHHFMMARNLFLPLHLAHRIPPLRSEVAGPNAVSAAHGDRLSGQVPLWPRPAEAPVEISRSIQEAGTRVSWLRFRSPVLEDPCLVRVEEPSDRPVRGTLVFLHGVCMETEFWRGLADPLAPLLRAGLRIARPEGPWHGRRRAAGYYGGEPVLGRGPIGLIELFEAWVAETALVIGHLRAASPGPLALGGVSLGALTAQLLLCAARRWPAAYGPDAALLVATSGAPDELADRGSLVRALGQASALRAAGWDDAALERVLPLLAPLGEPVVPPERLVMLLGTADDLVPYAGGAALARRWRLPQANLFTRRQGHFSVSLGLAVDRRPLERLLAVMPAGGPTGCAL